MDVEPLTQQIGRQLLADARQHRAGFFSSRYWTDQLMNWAMEDQGFKVQMFRFVDVFPMLRTSGEVYECLVDYLSQPGVTLPTGMDLGLKAGGLARSLVAKTVAGRIRAMAANFIAGTDPQAAMPKLEKLWRGGMASSVDLLGEACLSDGEAEVYRRRYLELVHSLAEHVHRWPANPRLETDHVGPVPRANVSIKVSSLCARTDPIDTAGSIERLVEALRPILTSAREHNVAINFDMEQHAFKDLTLDLFERCCREMEFPAGLALQAYLRSAEEDARRVIAIARETGRQIVVRLIKGAYWDYEWIHAERMGWPAPVWSTKRETDAAFERVAEMFVAAAPRQPDEPGVKLALGSHNIRSIAHVLALLRGADLPENAVEFQVLYGMADQLKTALTARKLRVREYVPLGELIPGMAYLVRRLLENTSNQSWLRAGFSDRVPDETLLASPHVLCEGATQQHAAAPDAAARHQLSPAVAGLGGGRAFANEPQRDFSDRKTREAFAAAVERVTVPESGAKATVADAEAAVERAARAFLAWRATAALQRSELVLGAAARMRDRRDELAGIMVHEAGKTWREADADVCEAIDFAEYYARLAVGLFEPRRLGRFVGELNLQWYQPRGVAAVISPWNFPLAICAGMTLASLVTGNAAIVKPSSQTVGVARAMCEMLWEAGVPRDVLQLVAGSGGTVGAALVRHPQVSLIAFTGSKEVGLEILRAAGEVPDGQGHVKKVVCEMGGKNAAIVDATADLDEAVAGVRQSAFGYSGQKCSACSRAVVLEGVYESFVKRLIESTRTLVIGDPRDPATDVGPVIDAAAAEKIRRYVEIGQQEGHLAAACEAPAGLEAKVGRPYVGPHIFTGIQPEHRLAQEEIFGPVLSVLRVSTFDEALAVANGTGYKLTGGVFSRTPAHLELARREFRVGNLYLNRGITGALVGRQPFGGFGLSGTGTKAGGADYLLHFVEPRSCTENTMRHGFAPGLD